MNNCSYIWITTSFEGYHSYKDAPDEVSFLKNKHRHIFHIKVWIEIFHNDRDIEFILFKRFVDNFIKDNDFNNHSCEMISDDLYKYIIAKYSNRQIQIEVSEDNENGSYKIYNVECTK